jgi:AcrR family transcriptional regulator
MARPRSAGFDAQREQMLAAAAQLFATRGYSATTMNDVAAACGLGKATLYHYVRDKHDLLAQIAAGHVERLQAVVAEVAQQALPPGPRLEQLILRFMQAYASAGHEHRVLTEDVKFLATAERERVLSGQREVVRVFADTVAALRPDLAAHSLQSPLAMLLFGMINWTFTWLRPQGALSHASLAPLVVQLFLGGLQRLAAPGGAAAAGAGGAGRRTRGRGAQQGL